MIKSCKKNKPVIVVVSLIIVAIILLLVFLNGTKTASKNIVQPKPDLSSVSNNPSEINPDFSYPFNIKDGNSNVFSGLLIYSGENGFKVEYNNDYDFGVFIESIKGIKNGDEGKYWQYYVNGTLGDVAADKKILKNGDIVEWRFEKVPF